MSQQRGGVAQGEHLDAASGLPSALGLALPAGVAIGLFFLSLARTASTAGLWPLLVARLASVVLFGVSAIAGGRSLRMAAPVAAIAIAGGLIDMLANVLYLIATRNGPLSVVVTLTSLYPASTVMLALVVLGERLSPTGHWNRVRADRSAIDRRQLISNRIVPSDMNQCLHLTAIAPWLGRWVE